MMKRMTVLLLGLMIAAPAMAEDVDRTLDAAPDGEVNISNIAGSVVVNGWSRDQVAVTGTLGRNVEELIFERDDDEVTIKVKVPKKGGRGIDSDLRISVPQDSSIDVSAVSADIDVTDVNGVQRLHTVSGDVRTEATASDVSAESVSGDVIVDEGSFSRASLNTVNGEVVFHSELRNGGRFSAETVNGDIDVEFQGDVSARIEIDTFNGSIRNCFGPKAERTSKYTPGWELSFTEGDGDGRVEMSTMNGDLSMCRK